MKLEIKEALGVLEIMHYDKYLGLPSLVGRHKKARFEYIKERFGGNYKGGKKSCCLK